MQPGVPARCAELSQAQCSQPSSDPPGEGPLLTPMLQMRITRLGVQQYLASDEAGFRPAHFIPWSVPGICACLSVFGFAFMDNVAQKQESRKRIHKESPHPQQMRNLRPREGSDFLEGSTFNTLWHVLHRLESESFVAHGGRSHPGPSGPPQSLALCLG